MKTALALVTVAGLALVAVAQPAKEAPKTATPAHTAPATATPAAAPKAAPATTPKAAAPTAAPDKAPSFNDMMKMWSDMNKPGDEHKELAKLIGEWESTTICYNPMVPGEKHESKGTESVEWLIEGRYAVSHTVTTMGEQPFTGFGCHGFNTMTHKFECTWVDSMSTGQMLYTGTVDANHVLTMTCDYTDPMTNTKKTSKLVTSWTNENTRSFKMYEVDGSNEVLGMECTYTRKTGTTNAKPVGAAPTEHTKTSNTTTHTK